MRWYVVRQGDCIIKIAARYGVDPDAVWSHPENAALRAARREKSVLLPGDRVFVPSGNAARLRPRVGEVNRYVAQIPVTTLEIKLAREMLQALDAGRPETSVDGEARVEPARRIAYRLEVGRTIVEGSTDDRGMLRASVPAIENWGVLTLEPSTPRERVVLIAIGHLDPETEWSGVRQRLSNLGILTDQPMHEDDEVSRKAVGDFQRLCGLKLTGQVDPETRDAIVKLHGS